MIMRIMQGGILAIWAIFLAWLISLGRQHLARLLHPDLWWLIAAASVILILLLIACCRQYNTDRKTFITKLCVAEIFISQGNPIAETIRLPGDNNVTNGNHLSSPYIISHTIVSKTIMDKKGGFVHDAEATA